MTFYNRKFLSCFLILVVVLISFAGLGTRPVEASLLSFISETAGSGDIGAATPVYGTLSSGNSSKLDKKDQAYMVMNSASNGTSQETSFWADFTLRAHKILTAPINFTFRQWLPPMAR